MALFVALGVGIAFAAIAIVAFVSRDIGIAHDPASDSGVAE